jgi:hypothetical protein
MFFWLILWLVVETRPANHTWFVRTHQIHIVDHHFPGKLTTRWAIPIFGHKPIFLRLFGWICPGWEAKYLLDEHHIALVDGGMRYLICGKQCWAWPRTISWWQMGEVDSGHPDVSNGKKSGLPTTCDVQKTFGSWVNSSVSRHSQRSYESYLCVYILFVDYIWHIISHYIPILSWVISPTAGTIILLRTQVSSARKVKGMCGLPTPVPQRCCWDWLPLAAFGPQNHADFSVR